MRVSLLSDDRKRAVHETSLSILEGVGISLPHTETLERFEAVGADVDFSSRSVKIPPDLVSWALDVAGKQFAIYGRTEENAAAFGVGTRNYNAIAGEASWLDEPGGRRRYPVLSDVAEAVRVCDALPNITIAGAMADPSDIPVPWRCVRVAATALANTAKPVTFWFHDRASASYLVELAVAFRGSTVEAARLPPYYPFLEPISPLQFPFDGVDLLYETARLPLPVPIGPMAQMGLTAPGSLAGTIAQENAEILAGICITQLIREGTPVCYGGICHAFDMGTTQLIFGGPEQALFGVAMTEMGKSYGLPVYINVGLTDSKRPDAQAGLEIGATLVLGAAAGADIFGHMGIAGVDQASSLEMLVFQDEVISYVESCMRSIDFSDESLGLAEVSEVGPGGTFIDRELTAQRFRTETWFPRVLDRRFYDSWRQDDARTTEDTVRAQLSHLRRHAPAPLPEDTTRDMESVVAAAERNLGD